MQAWTSIRKTWLRIGVLGLASGTWHGLVVNFRFRGLALPGAMVLYYVLVDAVDDAEKRGDFGSIFRRFGPITWVPGLLFVGTAESITQ